MRTGAASSVPVARSRFWMAAVLAVAVLLSCAAAWSFHGERHHGGVRLPATALHGLDEDQAACLRFGLAIRRSDAMRLTLALGRYQSLDPAARPGLQRETDRVRQVSADYPTASYRLVAEFGDVAELGSAVLASHNPQDYRKAVTGRSAAIAEANEACAQIAGFDVATLAVREAGQ